MSVLIIIFFILAIFHFIYQSILVPTFRLNIRYKYFKLRDELRRLKYENDEHIDNEVYSFLQDSLNIYLRNLPFLDFKFLLDAQHFVKSNNDVALEIQEKRKLIEECTISSVKKIYKEQSKLILYTLAINVGGWFIYLVPVFVVALMFHSIKEGAKNLIFFPKKDLDKIIFVNDIALT